MTRKVDELGRVVLPIEYRQTLNILEKDELEITLEVDKITIRKPVVGCHFCQSTVVLVRIGKEYVCRECIHRLQNAADGEVLSPVKIESV